MGFLGYIHNSDSCIEALPEPVKDFFERKVVYGCDVCKETFRVSFYYDNDGGLFSRNTDKIFYWERYTGFIDTEAATRA